MKQTVIIDMINGFCKEGALADPKIMEIVPNILEEAKNTDITFICDTHHEADVEFRVFPKHCIEDTWEAEIIDELKHLATYSNTFPKTTTNGMWEWQISNSFITHDDVVVMGCCTDICVLSFAIALRTFKTKNNLDGDVIIKKSCVATYDAPNHHATEYNEMAFKLMKVQGIKVVD